MAYVSAEKLISGMMKWAKDTPEGRHLIKVVDMTLRGSDASAPSKVTHLLTWATPEILLDMSRGVVSRETERKRETMHGVGNPHGIAYSLTASMRVLAGYMVAHGLATREQRGYNDE